MAEWISDPTSKRENTPTYRTGRTCPDCSIPESSDHCQWHEDGYGWHHEFTYSCEHYQQRVNDSPCKYCGKKNTPVRQIPLPIPVSDCYCDDCAAKCIAEYTGFLR